MSTPQLDPQTARSILHKLEAIELLAGQLPDSEGEIAEEIGAKVFQIKRFLPGNVIPTYANGQPRSRVREIFDAQRAAARTAPSEAA